MDNERALVDEIVEKLDVERLEKWIISIRHIPESASETDKQLIDAMIDKYYRGDDGI